MGGYRFAFSRRTLSGPRCPGISRHAERRITDPQDAVISGAKVTAIQVDTGAKFETVSGTDGLYTIPFLPPSQYRVVAEVQGFKRYQRDGVQASANERIGLDISMEVGQVTETIAVTAEAPMLQTTTASSGQVMGCQIENMPARAALHLPGAVAFGVTRTDEPRFTRPSTTPVHPAFPWAVRRADQ